MRMSDNTSTHSFDRLLNRLKSDPKISRNELRIIIETLIKIYKNLVTHKDNEMYRKIHIKKLEETKSFYRNVWRHSSAQELLLGCGWTETNERQSIVFNGTDSDASECLTILVNNRDIKPDAKDWVNSGKEFFNPEEQREKLKREEAAKERNKELEAFERDKKERQLIAENVKKDVESDIKSRQFKNQYFRK